MAKDIEAVLKHPLLDADKLKAAKRHALGVASIRALAGLRKRTPVRSGQTRGRLAYRIVVKPNGGMEGQVGGKSIAPSGHNILRGLEEGTGIYGPTPTRDAGCGLLRVGSALARTKPPSVWCGLLVRPTDEAVWARLREMDTEARGSGGAGLTLDRCVYADPGGLYGVGRGHSHRWRNGSP